MYRVVTRVTQFDERDGIYGYKQFLVGEAASYAEAAALRDREQESLGPPWETEADVVVLDDSGRPCYGESFCGPVYVPSKDEIPF